MPSNSALGWCCSVNQSTANPKNASGGPGKIGKKLPKRPAMANTKAITRRVVSKTQDIMLSLHAKYQLSEKLPTHISKSVNWSFFLHVRGASFECVDAAFYHTLPYPGNGA
jgi:hypothetical protein